MLSVFSHINKNFVNILMCIYSIILEYIIFLISSILNIKMFLVFYYYKFDLKLTLLLNTFLFTSKSILGLLRLVMKLDKNKVFIEEIFFV